MDPILEELRRQGSHHSSGSFTFDLEGALRRLGRYQLADPAHFVLRLVAVAVEGGATFFSLKGLEMRWDGAPLERDELTGLFDRLLRGQEARSAELAVALIAARTLFPRIELETGTTRLRLERERLTLEDCPRGDNRLVLHGGGWLRRHRLPGRLKKLLAERCKLAPLADRSLQASSACCVRFGAPPFGLPAQLALPATPWGTGYLLLGDGPARAPEIYRSGVRFDSPWDPRCPGCSVYWWTDNLTLDISRGHLVEDEQFLAWRDFVAEQLIRAVLTRVTVPEPYLPLVGWLKVTNREPMRHLPILRRVNGARATLAEVGSQHATQGWLGVSQAMWSEPHGGYDPGTILHLDLLAEELVDIPGLIRMDALRDCRTSVRLPVDVDYLLRMPTSGVAGEVGLRNAMPDGAYFLHTPEGTRVHPDRCPSGLDVSLADPEGEDKTSGSIFQLYLNLLHAGGKARIRSAHMLEFLAFLALAHRVREENGHNLNALLQKGAAGLKPGHLWLLVEQLSLPTDHGPRLLHAFLNLPAVPVCQREGWFAAPGPEPILYLTDFQLNRLEKLVNVERRLPVTRALRGYLLKQRMHPQSVYEALVAADRLRLPREPVTTRLFQACRRGSRSTVELHEAALDASEILADLRLDSVGSLTRAVSVHLRRGHTAQALELGQRAEALAPGNAQVLALLGRVLGLLGRHEDALQFYERALARLPKHSAILNGYARELLLAGRPAEARLFCERSLELDPGYAYAQELMARLLLETEPARALELSREAQRSPDFPPSAYEMQALAAQAVGRNEEAREALRQFIPKCRPEYLLENDLEARREAARRLLDALS